MCSLFFVGANCNSRVQVLVLCFLFFVLCLLFFVLCLLLMRGQCLNNVDRSLFTVYCSLFTVHCSLFTVHCSLTRIGYTLHNPGRRLHATQVVIKILFHPDRVINFVGIILQMVGLVAVLQKDHILIRPAHSQV